MAEEAFANGATPAAEDDIEAVKTLCSMGFSRTQAVTALESHDYDVQRALNSLLGEHAVPWQLRPCTDLRVGTR